MKIIPKFTPLDQLNGHLDNKNIGFTIFDSHYNYHNLNQMAELHEAFPDQSLLDLVGFKPNRIIEHEIIVALTTMVKIADLAQDFNHKFNLIKQAVQLDKIENIYPIYLDLNEITSNQDIKISDNYSPGKFVPNITIKAVKAMFMASKLSNQYLREMAKNKIKEIIEAYIAQGILHPLPEHESPNRVSFSVNGPIAAGKSSFEASIKNHIDKNYHILWDELAKINSDTYKFILSPNYNTVIDGVNLFSQLVHDEISLLQQMISQRLMSKLQETGRAPNVFFDKIFIHQENIEFALYNGGKLKGIMVSAPVEDALIRAEKRGEDTSRYEDSISILTSHASISTRFSDLLMANQGNSISYLLFDTKEIQQKTAEIDLENRIIAICNHNNFVEFIEKARLNVTASLEGQELIYNQADIFDQFNQQIVAAGYKIIYSCSDDLL